MSQPIDLLPVPSSSPVNPDGHFTHNADVEAARVALERNDFRAAIAAGFHLPADDAYVYHATAAVTLAQVQAAVAAGTAHGLCDWYVGGDGKPVRSAHSFFPSTAYHFGH